ncbi:kell blood group glycoprotein homolog [Ornithodoros turicata]|uniref:kell blood group glycoprotein homolog n=1 Tax=Ornithodoros turicata TaxID=34597 RepID=UPI003138DB72
MKHQTGNTTEGASFFQTEEYSSVLDPPYSQATEASVISPDASVEDPAGPTGNVQVRKRSWGLSTICWEAAIFFASLVLAAGVITTFVWALGPSSGFLNIPHNVQPSSQMPKTSPREQSELLWGPCGSAACMDLSNSLRRLINASVDPCDDFYSYVCHNWMLTHTLSKGRERISADDVTQGVFSDLLAAAVKDDQTKYVDLHAFFQTCLEPKKGLFEELFQTALSVLQLGPLKEISSRSWSDRDLSVRLGRAHRYFDIDTLFHFSRTEEMENVSYIAVYEPSLVLVRSSMNNAEREAAKDYFEPVLTYFRKIFYTDIVALEERLCSFFQRRRKAQYLEETPVLGTVDLPVIKRLDWPSLLGAAFGKFPFTARIRLAAPEYVFRLAVEDGVPPATDVVHYLVFKVAMMLLPWNDDKRVRETFAPLAYKTYPQLESTVRQSKTCVRILNHFEPNLPLLVAYNLAQSVIGGHDFIQRLLDHLRSVFRDGLLKSRSFSNVVRGHLLKKLDALSWEILVPTFLLNSTVRENFTAAMYPIRARIPSVSTFLMTFFEKTSQRRPLKGWRSGFLSSSPQAPYPLTRIQVPPTSFSLSLTGDAATKSLHIPRVAPRIYATLFDLLHSWTRSYDRGKPRRFARAYDNLRVCLARDYARMSWSKNNLPYVYPIRVNQPRPWQDLWDDLAVAPAFEAFHTYLDRMKVTLRLAYADGKFLDARRLFFVYYAASMCENASPRYYEWIAGDQSRSPAWYRVNGPLRHSFDFAEAFACKPGVFMNPVRKCDLPGWD